MTWKVWYQPHDKFGRRYHSGTLMIAPGEATYEGKKETFTIRGAGKVEPKMVGMNSWVHVAYETDGEARDAYFLDRRMLGWQGILGGNDKLRTELEEALL
jgi:hypothetical protein